MRAKAKVKGDSKRIAGEKETLNGVDNKGVVKSVVELEWMRQSKGRKSEGWSNGERKKRGFVREEKWKR